LKTKLCYSIILVFFLGSCSLFNDNDQGNRKDALARVYDEYLFPEDVEGIVPGGASAEDSLENLRSFIQSWARNKLILNYARENPNIDQDEIDIRIQNYQDDLVSHFYEKEIVRQKLDTSINEFEIQDYYNQYRQSFILSDDIISIKFVKITKGFPKTDSLKLWLRSHNDEDSYKLKDFCYRYNAINFFIKDSTWFVYDDIIQELPLQVSNPEYYFRYKNYEEKIDSNIVYLMAINGFQKKGNISPLNYVKENIKMIILNRRKLKVIKQTYDKIYQDALLKKNFEMYL